MTKALIFAEQGFESRPNQPTAAKPLMFNYFFWRYLRNAAI